MDEEQVWRVIQKGPVPTPPIPAFSSHRLEDLTLRDLEKQEREKAANSLEAFIFETQVSRQGAASAPCFVEPPRRDCALILAPKLTACMGLCPLQDKLYQPEYQEVSTEEQREEISGKLSATSSWLEDEGFGATTVVRSLLGSGRQMGVLPVRAPNPSPPPLLGPE